MVCFACLAEDPHYRICIGCRTKLEMADKECGFFKAQLQIVNQQNYLLKKEIGKLKEERANREDTHD